MSSDNELVISAVERARKQKYLQRARKFLERNRNFIAEQKAEFTEDLLSELDKFYDGDPDFELIIALGCGHDGVNNMLRPEECGYEIRFIPGITMPTPVSVSKILLKIDGIEQFGKLVLEWVMDALSPLELFSFKYGGFGGAPNHQPYTRKITIKMLPEIIEELMEELEK